MNGVIKPVTIAFVAALTALTPAAAQAMPPQTDSQTLAVEVAEDGSRFVWANTPLLEDGSPSHNNAYFTRGYIYPEGTLSKGVSGTLADGTPAFPEKVLGEWIRWGYYLNQVGAHPQSEPVVRTFELFDFAEGHDEETVLLSGVTTAGITASMPILGKTGPYVCGEAEQDIIGLAGSMNSFQLRYTFHPGSC